MAQTLEEIKAAIKQLPNVEAYPAWDQGDAEEPRLASNCQVQNSRSGVSCLGSMPSRLTWEAGASGVCVCV